MPTLLGGLTPEQFLAEYWQKKPLLVRGAFPNFRSPVTPDDLANLACTEDAEARLILEAGGDYPWELRHGPFDPEDFDDLPETKWTLLVQAVDRQAPRVAALLDAFRFVPNWRLDDVMVSFAPEGGGVGAHVDNYDVFLIQGLGRRHWQIHHTPVDEENLLPDLDVAILADFEPDAAWTLEPGDMLYLPPRIPHYGVALDDCMTLSVGFRAPGEDDLLTAFFDHVLATHDPGPRFADPGRTPTPRPGLIDDSVRTYARDLLRRLTDDDDALDAFLGRFLTEPQRDLFFEGNPYPPEALITALRVGAVLRRRALADLAFLDHGNGSATLFARGEAYRVSAAQADLLTGPARLDHAILSPFLEEDAAFAELLAELVEAGALWVSHRA